jgi:hypothetical protein
MAKSIKNTVKKTVKNVKKVEQISCNEDIEILNNVSGGTKYKLTTEYKNRLTMLSVLISDKFTKNNDDNLPSLSDCEKLLSIAFDCRNTARKLSKHENSIIIA